MKITADTNLLVRMVAIDNEAQTRLAQQELREAEMVAIPLQALCEFVWVLNRGYRLPIRQVAEALRGLVAAQNVVTHEAAVAAGLDVMDEGGDFADGVMAYDGHWLGAEEFVSFDREAVALLEKKGVKARVLE